MLFLSYQHDDESFAAAVDESLNKRPYVKSFFYPQRQQPQHWSRQVDQVLPDCTSFVLFVPIEQKLGAGWLEELKEAISRGIPILLVLRKNVRAPELGKNYTPNWGEYNVERFHPDDAPEIAQRIISILGLDNPLDVPLDYPFDYEKEIIKAYAVGEGKVGADKVAQGCPADWPVVERLDAVKDKERSSASQVDTSGDKGDSSDPDRNPVPEAIVGGYRKPSAAIVVDARPGWGITDQDERYPLDKLSFPEAGPRQKLYYPAGQDNLTVGIVVSGGIAPGINAVIESIVDRHTLYWDEYNNNKKKLAPGYALKIRGYLDGFNGFLRQIGTNWLDLDKTIVKGYAGTAGAKLRTSRADTLLLGSMDERYTDILKVVDQLEPVQILYVIGGEGSMRAAHAIWKIATEKRKKERKRPISVVGIPKTMDNDILWVWQSFGFLSAVEEARKAILNLHTEATSNPRLSIIQLFGSDSGFVVSHAALASGLCDAALIPEVRFSIGPCRVKGCHGLGLSPYICQRLRDLLNDPRKPSPSGLIVMAETAIPDDAERYIGDPFMQLFHDEEVAVREFIRKKRRVHGQTPDELRSAGLKIVSRALLRDIQAMETTNKYWKKYRVFTNEPRHLLRSIVPSVSDVVFGERLGALAVDNAMAGYTDFMVSQWLTEYVLVPLKLVTLGRKRIREDGMFWKSVLASTGQRQLSHDSELHKNAEQRGIGASAWPANEYTASGG